jgi:radical SAM-linked protein
MDGLYERRLKAFVKLNCTDPGIALIESVLSRGDRRWSRVIKDLWQNGSRLESWAENFSISRWQDSASKFELDLNHEASRFREPGSKQPWDALSIGFTDKFLLHEWNQAVQELETIPCTENKCHACGVCFNLDVVNVVTVDRSAHNPFVTVIDIEKRKQSCAGLLGNLPIAALHSSSNSSLTTKSTPDSQTHAPCSEQISQQSAGGTMVVVKHTQSVQKLQIKITKLGDLKYISHLDFQKMIERALRRTGLPVVHSTGFNQRMKISWLSALPLFVESDGEYIEIDLAESFDDLEKLTEILNLQLPEQARIVNVVNVGPQNKLSKLEILETVYIASKDIEYKDLEVLVEGFLKQETITIERFSKGKTKSVDIKPEIVTIKVLNNSQLELTLRKSQRADQVLQALLPGTFWNLRKTKQEHAATQTVAA